jgi:hypothetical protein
VFVFETAVHSVHHLNDEGAAEFCAFALLCEQGWNLDPATRPLVALLLVVGAAVGADLPAARVLHPVRTLHDRAPPTATFAAATFSLQ